MIRNFHISLSTSVDTRSFSFSVGSFSQLDPKLETNRRYYYGTGLENDPRPCPNLRVHLVNVYRICISICGQEQFRGPFGQFVRLPFFLSSFLPEGHWSGSIRLFSSFWLFFFGCGDFFFKRIKIDIKRKCLSLLLS